MFGLQTTSVLSRPSSLAGLLRIPAVPVCLAKRRSHNPGEDDRRVAVHLDALSSLLSALDLPPGHGLVRSGAGVRPVKLLPRIDVHGKVRAVAEEHGVGDLVLAHAPAEDDHARLARLDGEVVQPADVPHEVDGQAGGLVRVEVEHVAQGAVRQGGAEDGDLVLWVRDNG